VAVNARVSEHWMRGAQLASLAILAVVLAWLAVDLVAHADRHAAWSAVRAQLGTANYDAARSDRLYDAVYAARDALRRDAMILGLVLLVLAICAPAKRPAASRAQVEPDALRRLGATLGDGALLTLVAGGLALASRTADRGGSEALAAVLGRLTLLLPLAIFALAERRQRLPSSWLTPQRTARTPANTLARALLTLPAAALVLLLAPFTVVLALRRPTLTAWLVAPQEALLGPRLLRDASRANSKSNAPVEKSADDR